MIPTLPPRFFAALIEKTTARIFPIYSQLYRQYATFPDYFHPNISKYWGDLIQDFHKIIEFDGLWIVSTKSRCASSGSLPKHSC